MRDQATGDGAYPADLERDVPLRDGGTVHLRPIRPDDVGRLQAFHGRLSRDSIFFRFFSPLPVLTDERAAYFTTLDYDKRLAIVAVERDGQGEEQIIGVIRYDRSAGTGADGPATGDPRDAAEFALIVEDRYQHHGIGSVLFWALVAAARVRGIRTFSADILAENRRMLLMLRGTGLPSTSRRAGNAIHVDLDLVGAPS
jgi:GNAT superfamily N-acetyltransferase